jgi:hypothetical protein
MYYVKVMGSDVIRRLYSRPNLNPDHWTSNVLTAWQSGLNVHSLDQYLSTDFTFSQEFPEVLQYVVMMTEFLRWSSLCPKFS